MEALIEHSSEEDLKKRHLFMTCDNEDEPCHLIDRHRKRKNVISLPFIFRRSIHESESQGHPESELKPPLFDFPLSLVCDAEHTLPKSIQDILTILFQKGPLTEGIFRKAANEKARKELKEELNAGDNIALGKKSVYLLAVVFKDFLRSIPHKLLLTELYDEWMTALEKMNHQEKIEAVKEVASKLPQLNLHLLKHLLSLLHHINKNSKVNKMDSSNLAICFGPTMLSPNCDKSLPLEIQKELAEKVKSLVEFLINNCSDIFGEEIYSLLCRNTDNSLDMTEMSAPNQHRDSAYNSTDLEGECSLSDLQLKGSSHTSRPSSTELYSKQPRTQIPSALSLARFKTTMKKLERREGPINYGNLMYDRRVVRGNTYAMQLLSWSPEPAPAEIKKRYETHKKMLEQKERKKENEIHAPKIQDIENRSDVQTELYLEEILDRIIEVDMECQTDAFIKRLPSPVFIPQKTGVDVSTQIEEGELFNFDIEVKPMLQVLVGKTLEQALLEVMEEEDLSNLRAHQYAYQELRNAELAEVQRLEEKERRHREEKVELL
ncbi:T-cell activation Rho GTPase-activating protein [Crotalus adamanteus]|uniref:T-cell activation Rho GTPase-activating protein n=1 Tax=Crotalus adamanteus TaxID=8729 RepID=A0AAW1CD48_CROAD